MNSLERLVQLDPSAAELLRRHGYHAEATVVQGVANEYRESQATAVDGLGCRRSIATAHRVHLGGGVIP